MITKAYQVVGIQPDISEAKFTQVLKDADSPAAGNGPGMYQAIIKRNISPAFALALFQHESNFGKLGVCHDYQTFSMGNTRSSRIGVDIFVSVSGKGQYVKYDDWETGARDLAVRLMDPDFIYARTGLKTIAQILPVFAPVADSNRPDKYIEAVVSAINSWIGSNEVARMTTKPNIVWKGSPNHYTGRDDESVVAICDHIMQGTMESTNGWFNNQASEVSSTFGVAKDGRIWQWVKLEDAAWANGKVESVDQSVGWLVQAVKNGVNPNNLTVSIEHEGNTGDVMPESQYQATLALHKWLISLYPAIKVDRQHIIGHYQIMSRTKANCPGKGFPWSRLLNDLANEGVDKVSTEQGPKPAVNSSMLINGHVLAHGMLDYWNKVAVPGIQHPLGLPLSEEQDYTAPDGTKLIIQVFERGVLGYDSSIADPAYRVQGLIIGPEWVKTHLSAA